MTKQALRAAKVYLRNIDGDDYLDPEHGHDLKPLHSFRQRVLNAWQACGAESWVKSSHVAEKLQASETRVSKALIWLEENKYLE